MKLFKGTEKKTKDKNSENVLHLGITEVVLIHCNVINNNYRQGLKVLYALVPDKSFCQLLEIFLKKP